MDRDHADRLSPYVNKTVPFRFSGRDMSFRLSHALFSSFDIDDGTRLLLKSMARNIDLDQVHSALDVGCGVGVVGMSIHARAPGAATVMEDRDALAVALARQNCLLNGAGEIAVECRLAFLEPARSSYDLIASNLPAKAGKPVLEAFLRGAVASLAPEGIAAVVIVAPLSEFVEGTVRDLGCTLECPERSTAYAVIHFRGGRAGSGVVASSDAFRPYLRARRPFAHGAVAYELDTAWSLPDFDTLGREAELAMEAMPVGGLGGALAFWNPGQGHLPAYAIGVGGKAISAIHLVSRDCLELAITQHNLRSLGGAAGLSRALPSESWIADVLPPGGIDFLCAVPHPVPWVPWQAELAEAAEAVLKRGSLLLLASSSTEVHRCLSALRGFRIVESRKREGSRAVLLERA